MSSVQDLVLPIHSAAVSGDLEAVEKELSKGVDVNRASFGSTALLLAAACGHLEIAKLLVKHKATIDTALRTCTPLHKACQYGYLQIAELLLDEKANIDAITTDEGQLANLRFRF